MRLQHDAEKANFPEGLVERFSDFSAAQQEAASCFKTTYGAIVKYNGDRII